jgi:hypothetical protein
MKNRKTQPGGQREHLQGKRVDQNKAKILEPCRNNDFTTEHALNSTGEETIFNTGGEEIYYPLPITGYGDNKI